ncbi:YqaE/Pmp3 family membrane protein [Litchfieldella anticariensis]|uniref:YqaE/Pmp3 family membrane protein n=1 Tax=Litchfieldella anticariensis TaxID=258591 RepID=UPI0003FA6F77
MTPSTSLHPTPLPLIVFLPPVSVLQQAGRGRHLWVNILLTLFGYLPGVLHAWWLRKQR